MKINKIVILLIPFVFFSACEISEPVIEMASKNVISISYDAYGSTPTLTAEAIDIAMSHCKSQGGLFANYRGVSVPNEFSAKEIHTFACERVKTDDNIVIAAQEERYAQEIAATASAIEDAFVETQPIYTNCSTYGNRTSCTSY